MYASDILDTFHMVTASVPFFWITAATVGVWGLVVLLALIDV